MSNETQTVGPHKVELSLMPWPFGKRHLRHSSLREWVVKERIPTPFSAIQDRQRFDEVMNQYGELRKHLFDVHFKTLIPEQQRLLTEGKHPSQDHALTREALPFAEALSKKLKHLPYVREVKVANYHMNRNLIYVYVDGLDLLDSRLSEVPDFFEGFEVKAVNSKSILNETNPSH